tara:strand:+ start:137 stop:523 length:387 start_codon:yes stop_codon:yes gene_type:complete
MVSVIGAGVTAKKLADAIEKAKKEKQSRNPDPKTVEETDKENRKKKTKEQESNGDLEITPELIDQIKKKFKDKDMKLQSAYIKKKSPADIRDREKVKMAKGGRAMYGSGARVCKLAKRGKGKAYGKNS